MYTDEYIDGYLATHCREAECNFRAWALSSARSLSKPHSVYICVNNIANFVYADIQSLFRRNVLRSYVSVVFARKVFQKTIAPLHIRSLSNHRSVHCGVRAEYAR